MGGVGGGRERKVWVVEFQKIRLKSPVLSCVDLYCGAMTGDSGD